MRLKCMGGAKYGTLLLSCDGTMGSAKTRLQFYVAIT